MNALEVSNLKKTYEDPKDPSKSTHALKGISFEIRPGEIFGLLGPNGAGKTTLISTITTLEKPSSGDVRVFGIGVQENSKLVKQYVGTVHQEVINTGYFDIIEILKFQSGYYGLNKNIDRINFLVDRLGLKPHAHKKVKQLSGGMKRRLMIAKALVHSPKLLLLDEPTAGVDVELRESLWRFVRELQRDGMSILLTTHYLEEAEQLCHRIAIINKGELNFLGDPKEVIQKYSTKKLNIKLTNGDSKVIFSSAADSLNTILAQHKISMADVADIQMTEGKLEEAFTKVVSAEGAANGVVR
ncbi:MAG: ABC transporter ATP-binding protein [Pseudobdellovibrio sp.]|nr:ABC transporter ATP-binding protein [Pseudobdellovibrio sp.]